MELSERKKKNIQKGIGLTAFAAALIVVQQFYFSRPSLDQQLMQVASEINKTCPIMVDAETRLDNTLALTGNVFQYNYTLVNADKLSMDVEEFKNSLTPLLLNNVKTNPDIKVYRDNKTTMAYYYRDRNGEFLTRILITPDLYH